MTQASIIAPTYNRAEYLSDAISGIINQIFNDYKVIVIDNGSTTG